MMVAAFTSEAATLFNSSMYIVGRMGPEEFLYKLVVHSALSKLSCRRGVV